MFNRGKRIIGLIGANSPGGGNMKNGWELIIHLVAWRYAGSPIVEKKLRLEMPVSYDDLKEHMNQLKPYQIIEVETKKDGNDLLKKVKKIIRTNINDAELEEIRTTHQKPIELDHPLFGKLIYNRRYDWYEGNIDWCGQLVEITLSCSDPNKPDDVLNTATILFTNQNKWLTAALEFTVEQLLEIKNNNWLDEDEEMVTNNDFINRMTLETISVEEDSHFSFWFDDDNLFLGHAIQVTGTLKDGFTLADIPG